MSHSRCRRSTRARPARPPSARESAELEALRAAVMARYDRFAAELAEKQAATLAERTAATSHFAQNLAGTDT